MSTRALPYFLSEPYHLLQTAEHEGERAKLINLLTSRSIAFLGKIILLEYLQGSYRPSSITYGLLSREYPDLPRQWLDYIRPVMDYLSRYGTLGTLTPVRTIWEKYPGLKKCEGSSNKIERLLLFYDLFIHGDFLLSTGDIQENEEILTSFLDNFSFLENVRYHTGSQGTKLLYAGNELWLYPFYKARGSNDGMVLEIAAEGNEAIEAAFHTWISTELDYYKSLSQGEVTFTNYGKVHKEQFVLSPWLEIELQDALEQIAIVVEEIEGENILMIEGYPGAGKTALAVNVHQWSIPVDHLLNYFIMPETALQKHDTFEKWLMSQLHDILSLPGSCQCNQPQELLSWWLDCRYAFSQENPKILIVIDGIDHMADQEAEKLLDLLRRPPINRILFVLLKRTFTLPQIEVARNITLKWQDNINFEKTFHAGYRKSLVKQYLSDSSLATDIFSLLARNISQDFSVVDIAEKLDRFSPQVLKTILKMKPLCSIMETPDNDFTVEKYRLFHPVCQYFIME